MPALLPEELDLQMAPIWRSVTAVHRDLQGSNLRGLDVAEEAALAIRYNGIPHAVMMGTPLDLDDFAVGFSIAEGIARSARDLKAVTVMPGDDGIAIEILLKADALHRFLARRRVRSLRGYTSCGICGVEDLDALAPPTASPLRAARPIGHNVLRNALDRLRGSQPLSTRTHGAHAAAWVDFTGSLSLVREDIGRHNALDKLVGAALRADTDFNDGFCLITSRCSYEMAQKAITAGIPALVAISAPTALAIRTAQAAGLTLLTLARSGGFLVYAAPDVAFATFPMEHADEERGQS
jgi:FdhD protein